MKKINSLLSRNGIFTLVILIIPLICLSQTAPVPENTPSSSYQRGPAPPPDAPIDSYIILLFIAALIFAYQIMKPYLKNRQLD